MEAVGSGSLPSEAPPEREGSPAGAQTAAAGAVSIIRTLGELERLAEGWEALAARSGLPMQDHAWTMAIASTFAADGRLHIVAAGAPPDVTAIAPLAWSRCGGSLELIGVHELGEPMDFLYADPSALAPLAAALARLRRPLRLTRLPAASPAIAALRRAYRGQGVVIDNPAEGWPWIPLDAGWREPEAQLNSGRRSDLRRARRIAEKTGPLATEVVSPTPDALAPLLDEAMRVEAASWKGSAGTALAEDPERAAFFRRYAAAACRKGTLRLCFLRIGGQAAAMQIAIASGDRFSLLKIGYDQAFARCSPGSLLMCETIRYAAAHGVRSYEFLGANETWTHVWTQYVQPCASLRAYPVSLRGIAAVAKDTGRFARGRLGRLLRRTPG